MTIMSINLNTTPNSTEIYLEGEKYSSPNECYELDSYTQTTNLQGNNETAIDEGDVPGNNSTDSLPTPNLYQIIFGASDKNLFPSQLNECNKYKIWESIDQLEKDQKITRWYKDFLQFFGEYIGGQYHYYPRDRQEDQVVEHLTSFNDNGYTIYNCFLTPNGETFFAFITSVQNDGPIINIHMNMTKWLFGTQYQPISKVGSLDLQLGNGTGQYSARLIKSKDLKLIRLKDLKDLAKGEEPIIDATIYDPETTKSLSIIFYELVPRLMKLTSLTRSNELLQRLYNYYINEQLFRTTASSMASVLSFFNMSGNIDNLKFDRN